MSVYKRYDILFILMFFAFMFFGCSKDKAVIEAPQPMVEQLIEKFTITETHKGKLKMILEAESAVANEKNNLVHLKLPVIKFYDKKGGYISTLAAESADICMKTYDIKTVGKCTIDTKRSEHLQTNDLMYNAEKDLVYSSNNVKITKPGETVYGTSFEADTKLDKIVVKNHRIVFD
ncbi:MAG: LPS export ABC transporter periplasmic protein LptC [Endomicrobium sp.]|nr:LPS export ABC transporter periplasmic protein LptC [Endomicrobium sp.]